MVWDSRASRDRISAEDQSKARREPMSDEQVAQAESQALQIQGTGMSLSGLAQVFVQSGFFKDVRQQSQAIVKVLLGQELGLKPIQSMMGIHIVEGKPEISAALMAALVKRSGRYDYEVTQHTDAGCEIAFFALKEGQREAIGSSGFTIEDAKRAGLASRPNWQHYPRNMCFARALSNGVKWYCGDAIGGLPVYTEQELSDAMSVNGQRPTIDKQTGEVLDPEVELETNEYAPRRKAAEKPQGREATADKPSEGGEPAEQSGTRGEGVASASSPPNTPQEAERVTNGPRETPPKDGGEPAPGAPPGPRGRPPKSVPAPSVPAEAARPAPEDHPVCDKAWQGFACELPAGHKMPHQFTRGLEAPPAPEPSAPVPDVGKSEPAPAAVTPTGKTTFTLMNVTYTTNGF